MAEIYHTPDAFCGRGHPRPCRRGGFALVEITHLACTGICAGEVWILGNGRPANVKNPDRLKLGRCGGNLPPRKPPRASVAIWARQFRVCWNYSSVRYWYLRGEMGVMSGNGRPGIVRKRLKPLKLGRYGGNLTPARFRGLPSASVSMRAR